MTNPFVFNGYEGAASFFDREDELALLMKCVSSKINVTLIAQRRMGKTGLIFRLMDELINSGRQVTPIYVDIFATRDLADLNKCIANAIVQTFPAESNGWKKIMDLLKGLRPLFGIDPLTGSPQVLLSYQNGKRTHARGAAPISGTAEDPCFVGY